QAGRLGARLLSMVAQGVRGRIYLSPTDEMQEFAKSASPTWKPEGEVPSRLTCGTCYSYGLTTFGDLFSPRQLVALTTFSDVVGEARERIRQDAISAGMADDAHGLETGGVGATAYAEALTIYLALSVDKA